MGCIHPHTTHRLKTLTSMQPYTRPVGLPNDRAQNHREPRAKKAQVLFFTPSLGNGGAEMHVLRAINALDRSQFTVSVALAQTGGTYEAALAEDVAVYALNPPHIRSSLVRTIRAILPLRRLIQTVQPDLLCAVQDHANLAAILACYKLAKPPRLAISVQNAPIAQYHRLWHPLDRLMCFSIAHFYDRADQIIAISQGVAAEIATLMSGKPCPLEVIYNAGVDPHVLQGATHPIGRDRAIPLIVACGRLHEQKGFSYLIDALARVRETVPAHLWIVGEGPLKSSLERQIQKRGLSDCVRLVGFQSNPYQYMAAADVFVLSSLYEGFGNVIVEAMACGTPVIATRCHHGPAEIIEDGVNGLLVPPADGESLAQAIARVLTDSALRQHLSDRGRLRSQDFQAQTIAATYGNLFLQLLAQSL